MPNACPLRVDSGLFFDFRHKMELTNLMVNSRVGGWVQPTWRQCSTILAADVQLFDASHTRLGSLRSAMGFGYADRDTG